MSKIMDSENKLILNEIKKNSGVSDKLIEASDTSDIYSTQNFIGSLIDEKYNSSLLYQVCEVQPASGTFNTSYASKRNEITKDFEVIKKDIYIITDKIKTGFSWEVWQDMIRVFKSSALKKGGNILSKLSTDKENIRLIEFIDTEAEVKPALTLNDPTNFESVLHQIGKKVAESVLEMNFKSYNTLDSFCILPPKWAAAALGSFEFMNEGREESLFVGRIGRCDFYVNPIPTTSSQFNQDYDLNFEIASASNLNYAYIGLKSDIPGHSSLIFCPYQYELQNVTNPDTLTNILFLYNRYGLNSTPLHDKIEGKGMLHKFNILEV